MILESIKASSQNEHLIANEYEITYQEFLKLLTVSLLNEADFELHTNQDGVFDGFLIEKNISITLKKMGLQNGDIIQSINGTNFLKLIGKRKFDLSEIMEDKNLLQDLISIYQKLRDAREIYIQLMRNKNLLVLKTVVH